MCVYLSRIKCFCFSLNDELQSDEEQDREEGKCFSKESFSFYIMYIYVM